MPEIGECYTIARLLDKEKDEVKEIVLSPRFKTHILKTPLFKIESLKGLRLNQVFAYGKSVWMEFVGETRRVVLVSQLGMSGSWFIDDNGRNTNNDHFVIQGKKKRIRYSDPRMFGKMRFFEFSIDDTDWKEKTLENFSFGKDPVELSTTALTSLIKERWNKDKEIKVLMMEQNVLFGIGNYLCSEMLYESKIHPQKKGKDLTELDFSNLAKAIKKVIALAIKTGGHSFAEGFFHPDGSTGSMSKYIKVYGKDQDYCPEGHKIERIEQAGRGTFFCSRCQSKGR